MTGLTAALFDDFRAMREIKQVTHSDAPVKVRECMNLFKTFMESSSCNALIRDMNLEFVDRPLKVSAYKLDAGKMLMGMDEKDRQISLDIECCGRDLERKVQCQMYSQPPITKWGIFFQERDAPSAKEFNINMERTIQQFGYQAKQMASFMIKGHNIEMWKETLHAKLDNTV